MKIDLTKLPLETRGHVKDRSAQAQISIRYQNCIDKDGNDFIDVYPCSDGRAWKVPFRKSKLTISPEAQEAYRKAVEPYANASWIAKQQTYLDVPCASAGCPSFASVSVHDLELHLSQGFVHPENQWLFCKHCRGLTDKFLDRWKAVCPKLFREGETATDPRFFPPTAWASMRLWASKFIHNTRSLYVYGQSGVGKSRMMFELLREFIVPLKLSFKVYAGGEFRREQEQLQQNRFERKGDRITFDADEIDLLVFDDFGQDDLMPSMKSNLRLLVDRRLGNGLKTIFLANVAPDNLHVVYGSGFDTNSLKRRILDFCEVVGVAVSKQNLDASIAKRRAADDFLRDQ